MNWLVLALAATAVMAGPVVASVVAPSFVTGVAERGFAVHHRHFVFGEAFDVVAAGQDYRVEVDDADVYEMPLTTQVVLRGAVRPAPSDAQLDEALQHVAKRHHLPLLSYDVERSGETITVKATLPAGIAANLSPQYRALVEKYES